MRARVIVASHRAATGVYADTSGPLLVEGLRGLGCEVDADPVVVPDGAPVADALRRAVADGVDVVLTSGGTGANPTDRTPEATREVLDAELPGIAEAVRAYSRDRVPTAVLSRGLAGYAGRTLVVNLPGSTGGARDGLAVLGPVLAHAVDQLRGGDHPAPGAAADPRTRPGHGSDDGHSTAVSWDDARDTVHRAGLAAARPAVTTALSDAEGHTLAEPLVARTDLPAFPTSSVDGWAVRGAGPWRPVGRVLAGHVADPLDADGTCVEIATGAMVPAGAAAVLRTEESTRDADGRVRGTPRPAPEWRLPGEEAHAGEELLPAGTAVDPAVVGLAATCGYDALAVRARPTAAVLVFGDELRTAGPPGDGRVRDSLGPQVPGWLRRCGADVVPAGPGGPVRDTLEAHVEAVRAALAVADVVCTTGGTMHGPVDHLHPALAELGAGYVVDTVAVRPGFPMLLARVTGPDGRDRFVAGLPGNPQSAIIALVTLVAPLLAGLHGRDLPALPTVVAGAPVPDRPGATHLALAALDASGAVATPVGHVGSAMLRGLAGAHGFVVVRPGGPAAAGDRVPFLPLPLLAGERR